MGRTRLALLSIATFLAGPGMAHAQVTEAVLACLAEANDAWSFSALDGPEGIRDSHLRAERRAYHPLRGKGAPLLDVDWATCGLIALARHPARLSIGTGAYLDAREAVVELPTLALEDWIVEVAPSDPDARFEMALAIALGLPADPAKGPSRQIARAEDGGVDFWFSTLPSQPGVVQCDAWDISAFLDVARAGHITIDGEDFRVSMASLTHNLNPVDRPLFDGTFSQMSPCAGAMTLIPD